MLNRRLIRIKVYQAFYAYMQSEQSGMNAYVTYLKDSLSGVYNTFLTFITFPVELAYLVEHEMNPSEKFIQSPEKQKTYNILIIKELREKLMLQPEFRRMLEKPHVKWSEHRELQLLAYKRIRNADFMGRYMEMDALSIEDQIDFLRDCYGFMANDFEEFDSFMEELEMHWEDEKPPVVKASETFIENLRSGYTNGEFELPTLTSNMEEDMAFGEDLLKKSIRQKAEFTTLIAEHTKGWDADRIARSDMLLMVMALVEYTEFPYIPVKVTMNEYLEIAKKYSTPQSSKFLNGVLDKLFHQLKEDGRITKKGRGLME